MARAPRKRTAGKKRKKPVPGWIYLAIGVVIGLGFATWAVIGPFREEIRDLPVATNTKPKAKPIEVEIAPVKSSDADYDFYDSLQNDKTKNRTDISKELAASHIKETPKTIKNSTTYYVQIGSFRNFADADQLKAEFAFLGIIANVVEKEVKNITWHRVMMGPYSSKREAEAMVNTLQKDKRKAFIVSSK